MQEKTDQQLIADYLKGDAESLEILIGRHLNSVYRFASRYAASREDTDDITQEIFVKVWRNLKKFKQDKNFRAWLFTIAKNSALDWQKKKRTVPFSAFETEDGENIFVDNLPGTDPSADRLLEQKESAEKVNSALNSLSPKYKIVISLYSKERLNFREISEKLGEPINTIKSRYRRGLALMRKLLAKT
jgi:RNA polymerase sigma-70 factor (ECF subfamily)